MGRGGEQSPGKNWKIVAPLRHGKEQMCSPYPVEVLAQARLNKELQTNLPPAKVGFKAVERLNVALPQPTDDSEGYMSQPIDRSAVVPQVRWQDASEFTKDSQKGSKLPYVMWLGA